MRKLRILSLLALALIFQSCSTIKVVSNSEKDVDFSKYKTYSFMGWEAKSDKILEPQMKQRILEEFKDEFDRRKLELVQYNGDIMVSLFVVVDSESAVSNYNDHYTRGYGSYGVYNYGWGYGYSRSSYTIQEYEVGTIVMDVFDGDSQKQIWQGVASGTQDHKFEKRLKKVKRHIASLMRRFPIKN